MWISIVGVTAYVLASPLLFNDSLADSLWWVAAGVVAIGVVAAGALRSARAARDHVDELHRLDDEARDLAGICETRRLAMENIVELQLPALTQAPSQPPLPEAGGDDVSAALLVRAAGHLARVREDMHARTEAVQAAVVTLGRKVQASAHRIQEEASRMVQRHPADADVLHTSMRVDHAAAQQARNAQSLAALCGEWPGQQWHQALPIADVVRGAAGRITAYQRVEVSGDPGVAVSARVVEPLIHVIAELLANATQSSPPTTQVLVSLRHVQRGAVIEIDDGGVGLDDIRLEQVREIASGRHVVGLADLGEIPQTGLPVVGAYVRRHGFRVDITESVYGGLRAIVLVPAELTEPVAPSGRVAGGHVLTRRTDRVDDPILPEPAPTPLPETLATPASPTFPSRESHVAEAPVPPSPEPRPRPRPEPAPADSAATPGTGTEPSEQLPELPRRRSRRAEAAANAAEPVGWPGEQHGELTADSAQSAEEAGQWMGAFLSAAGRPATTRSNHQDPSQDTEDR
ncbi:sensor histidine kinase [Actinophytocola gossypii]|uniref:histidine kinase n=1 Tax=Actinophytocola gossypii TaxID=2812003 RepID=A0ABT2J905_9PSEU|nr:ATP-binding protein [Actinophytocola gossypii]MCT2584346.1 sensor histidine kinase [Actinophytocola gossypii]